MLEFIRTHRRLMQFLLLLIIFPSFAFFGVESYMRNADREPPVAKVAGQEISQREWDATHARQLERFKQMFGDQFNPAMFDTPDARLGALENLVAQRAMSGYVMDNHLTVSDETLRKTIGEIQGLKSPDGSFDKNSPERGVGKTCDLAFGYMGGLGAWRKFEPSRFSDEEVEKFKEFLDNVTPDQFAAAEPDDD